MTDAFAARAATWDDNPVRAAAARAFFEAALPLAGEAARGVVLDFGCGTGQIGLSFAPMARRVVLLDTSPAMLEVLRGKIASAGIANAEIRLGGPEGLAAESAGLIVSLNALHHVEDIPALAAQFRRLCARGGQVIVGDLVSEDGSFHAPESAPHNGFAPEALGRIFTAAGFSVRTVLRHHAIRKTGPDGVTRDYPQFLLQAGG